MVFIKNTKLVLLFSITIVLLGCSPKQTDVPIIPLEDFLRKSDKIEIKLSPSGDDIAFLQDWNGKLNIFIQQVGSDEITRITNSTDLNIMHFSWANNNQLIYTLSQIDEPQNKLFVIDKDGKNFKNITPFDDVVIEVVDFLDNEKDNLLVSIFPKGKKVSDVFSININNGKIKKVQKNPGNVSKWITDNSGTIRIAITTDGVNHGFLYRKDSSQKFEPIAVTNFKETISPQFFSADNKYIYGLSNKWRDKITAVKYDPEENEEFEILYENPEVDVEEIIRLSSKDEPIGVAYTTHTTKYHYFDEKYQKKFQLLKNKFPDYNIKFINKSRDGSKLIIQTFSAKDPGNYYYYNSETDEVKLLSELYPWLNKDYMANVKPIRYRARDGFTINGYLTIPKGLQPKNLPTVILPHGGPWIRNKWEFDKTVQFLANRGYLVLQMNFRGSTGYGREFFESGFGEWGHKMQDDITDGTRWLIRQGIADSTRIAIMGISFGGFCALNGVVQHPDLYRCAISYSGLTDGFSFLNTIPTHWEPFKEMIYEMIGDPKKDSLKIWQGSPIFHCEEVESPLLIIAGGKDKKINLEGLENFVRCLKKRDVHVNYLFNKDEGHQFMDKENKLEVFRYIEKFLAYNINGRIEK